MRTLRVSLLGAVILALLGLPVVGPAMAADGQCKPEESVTELEADEASAYLESEIAKDEVARLILALAQARSRRQAAEAKLAEAQRCLAARKDADRKADADAGKAEEDAGKAIDLPNRTTRTTPGGQVITAGDDIAYVIECTRTRHRDGAVFGPSEHPAADYDQLVERLRNTCLGMDGYTTERWIVVMRKGQPEWQPIGEPVAAHP